MVFHSGFFFFFFFLEEKFGYLELLDGVGAGTEAACGGIRVALTAEKAVKLVDVEARGEAQLVQGETEVRRRGGGERATPRWRGIRKAVCPHHMVDGAALRCQRERRMRRVPTNTAAVT